MKKKEARLPIYIVSSDGLGMQKFHKILNICSIIYYFMP